MISFVAMRNPKIYWGVKVAILIFLFFSVFSYIVMVLWNWLMPDLFGLPYINFWKAAGLLVLSKIIFSGMGGKKFDKKGHHGDWKGHFVDKNDLTPEQKQELKDKFISRWCKQYSEKQETPEDPSEQREHQA